MAEEKLVVYRLGNCLNDIAIGEGTPERREEFRPLRAMPGGKERDIGASTEEGGRILEKGKNSRNFKKRMLPDPLKKMVWKGTQGGLERKTPVLKKGGEKSRRCRWRLC